MPACGSGRDCKNVWLRLIRCFSIRLIGFHEGDHQQKQHPVQQYQPDHRYRYFTSRADEVYARTNGRAVSRARPQSGTDA